MSRTPAESIALAERAEREVQAQLTIIRVLKPLGEGSRDRIMGAVGHLLQAEALIPGVVLAKFWKDTE